MESRKWRRGGIRGMEENTMAILDSGFDADSQYLNDDRMAFLEAVRSASLVPENGAAPTNKMFEAIFEILKDEDSLELIMASYQLLNELDKRFPRVYASKKEKSESLSPSAILELVVIEEAWSPFVFGLDVICNKEKANTNTGGSIDSSGFHFLIEEFAKVADEANFKAFEKKTLRSMLLLQYLANFLKGDFLARNCVFKDSMNWAILRESLLNMLLGSRTIYKGLIKHCLSIICEMPRLHDDMGCSEDSSVQLSGNCDAALAMACPEVVKSTRVAVQELLLLMMDLDKSRKAADMQGLTTRADGVRTTVADFILDELTYNRDILSPFFQVFDEPNWKLEIIMQYFRKYIAKPSVRTRRSNGSMDSATFDEILKCFSDRNSAKIIVKKINAEVVQLLLAHGFQAYLSLPSQPSAEDICKNGKDVRGSCLLEICKNIISAFSCIKKTHETTEILPLGKEAIFTAATILSTKS